MLFQLEYYNKLQKNQSPAYYFSIYKGYLFSLDGVAEKEAKGIVAYKLKFDV